MKLARFTYEGRTRSGIVVGDEIVDLATTAPSVPNSIEELLGAGRGALDAVRMAVAAAGDRVPLEAVKLEAPLRPPKFFGVALNYQSHIIETGRTAPEVPTIFTKAPTSVTGPSGVIHLPSVSDQLDYEGELGLVIGRRCRHVSADEAADVIAGYVIVNDVSVRDWQRRTPTMIMGKSFDTHGPIGPYITTSDEVADPSDLMLRTWVNDELRQEANTSDMLFGPGELIAHISAAITLEPGDIIATGTPSGVGVGFDPPRMLKIGDVVKIEIEGLGRLRNTVVAEPDAPERVTKEP